LRAGAVNGNVALTNGTISVQGANAVGVQLSGDISGALVIQNAINTTGYRSTTPPADVSKLDADDLLQGGSAVVVGGNVAGGIMFDSRPADASSTDTDEDDDGIPDAEEGNASINSYGAAPAVQIGTASQAVTIGAVSSSSAGHGLVVKGGINGTGVYKGVSATGRSNGGGGQSGNVAGGATCGELAAHHVERFAAASRDLVRRVDIREARKASARGEISVRRVHDQLHGGGRGLVSVPFGGPLRKQARAGLGVQAALHQSIDQRKERTEMIARRANAIGAHE
jgi:hypothetical protein